MTRQNNFSEAPYKEAAVDEAIRRSLVKRKDIVCHAGATLFDTLAVFNVQYGNTWLARYDADSNKYIARCNCQSVMALSQEEVLGKVITKTGCRKNTGCSAESFEEKVTKDFFMFLKFQHWLLSTCCRSSLCSWWGGTADDAFIMVPPSVAQQRFAESLYHSDLEVTADRYWISRIDRSLPFMSGNLQFTSLPDKAVQCTINKLKVWKGGRPTGETLKQHLAFHGGNCWKILHQAFCSGWPEDHRLII